MDSLKDDLTIIDSEEEYSQLEICALYEVIDGTEVYATLNIEDKDVMDMLRPFSIMMQDNQTIISFNVWNDHVEKQAGSAKLSLTEIATSVWAPCLVEIQQIIESFHDRSVVVQKIDHYFKDLPLQSLEREVITLVEGCNKCLHMTKPTSWVMQFVNAVNSYRDACQAQNAAELVLKAKDTLMLTGNFKKLENFREKV